MKGARGTSVESSLKETRKSKVSHEITPGSHVMHTEHEFGPYTSEEIGTLRIKSSLSQNGRIELMKRVSGSSLARASG